MKEPIEVAMHRYVTAEDLEDMIKQATYEFMVCKGVRVIQKDSEERLGDFMFGYLTALEHLKVVDMEKQ